LSSLREETRGGLFGAFPIGAVLDHGGTAAVAAFRLEVDRGSPLIEQTEPLDFAC
jgi:hypothetical protein